MDILIIVFLGALILLVIGLFFFLRKKPNELNDSSGMNLLLQQINNLSSTLDNRLSKSQEEMNKSIRHQSTETSRIIADITQKITKLDETNKKVVSFTDQVKELQDILKNPKQNID